MMRLFNLTKHLVVLACLAVCMGPGCEPPPGGSGNGGNGDGGGGDGSGGTGGGSMATFAENDPAVTAATATAEQMAEQGSDLASIQSALLDQLLADPQVAGAAVDPANDVVYADFINGETQAWMVIDEATDPDAVLPDEQELQASAAAVAAAVDRAQASGRPRPMEKTGASRQPNPNQPFWNLPANNKALVANGLTFFHADWPLNDTTALVKKMLEARGYQVTAEPLSVEHFKNLTQYSVILIESHGLWREPDIYLELINRHPFTGEPEVANCGGNWSLHTLLTTTEATPANRETYKEDIRCGRLALRNVIRDWDGNGRKTTRQFYQVTPNFLAQYDKGTFPDYTLMFLNACRGYRDDLLSPFQDVLKSKCDRGSYFLGWTFGLRYFYGARAVLNLFQLMTASNEELIVNGVTVLGKTTPPRGGIFAGLNSGAYKQLDDMLYTVAPGGAGLLRTAQDNQVIETILAPHPLYWVGRDTAATSGVGSKPSLVMFSDASPAVTVGGNSVTVSPISLCCSTEWTITGSDAVYGDILVSQDNRTGIPVELHRWRPQIKLTGTNGGMSYAATFTLHARATTGFDSQRTSAWTAPPAAQFDETGWDPQGSNLSWTVSGDETIGNNDYHYEGTGLRQFGTEDGGWIESDFGGQTVSLEVYGQVTYTTTITDLSDGSTETVTTDQVVTISRSGIPLSANWTVSADSFSEDGDFGGTGQVTWNAFAADPPFDPNTEPR